MERSEGSALLNGSHDAVVDLHRAGKFFSAMDDTVSDSVDLTHGGDNTVLGTGQLVNDSGNGF